MKVYIAAYLGAFITFCLMDGIWLGIVATEFYFGALGDLLLEKPKWSMAAIFYIGYILGIVYFAIRPALKTRNFGQVLRDGALLGLLAYATYDMTNMATLKGWSLTVSIVDMIWGMVITGASAAGGYIAARRFV